MVLRHFVLRDFMIVMMRERFAEEDEFLICSDYLETVKSRILKTQNKIVMGRYSVLPYYEEVQQDVEHQNCELIHDGRAHRWIADITAWALGPLAPFTPATYTSWSNLPEYKSYILKGLTNSRKNNWATHMFAKTREDVPSVAMRLLDDSYIREQGIVVREYVPLKQLDIGINGLPITNEWRTFWMCDKYGSRLEMLAKGFYWKATHPEVADKATFDQAAQNLLNQVARIVAANGPRFFVLDVGQKEDGSWILIEVNDGQMSGLAGVDAHDLYSAIARRMR